MAPAGFFGPLRVFCSPAGFSFARLISQITNLRLRVFCSGRVRGSPMIEYDGLLALDRMERAVKKA
jgi:hypothetical protein